MTRILSWSAGSHRKLAASAFAVLIAGGTMMIASVATGMPRPPGPPWPEPAMIHDETFDSPLYWPTNQVIDAAVYAESWSGYCLYRAGAYVAPYTVPMLDTNGNFDIAPQSGAIRGWFQPQWSSLATGQGAGPGNLARLFTLATTNGGSGVVLWSLAFSADGNTVQLLCQTETQSNVCLSVPVSLQAGTWYLFTLGYTETNCALFVNDQQVASGDGLLPVPSVAAPYTALVIGSNPTGTDVVSGDVEEVAFFSGSKFSRRFGEPFGLSEAWEIAGYYDAYSPIAALGPISDARLAALQQARAAAVAAEQDAASASPSLMASPMDQEAMNNFACVTGGPVIITNFSTSVDPVAGMDTSFWVTGGTNGLLYDVYASSALNSPLTNAPWVWLGHTPTCSLFSVSGQTNASTLFILGTPHDSGNGGLPDAYVGLILKAAPPLGYTPSSDGFGTPDAWYLAHGLNPLTPGIGSQDSNGNGIPNWEEYRLGNDPLAQQTFTIWIATPNGLAGVP